MLKGDLTSSTGKNVPYQQKETTEVISNDSIQDLKLNDRGALSQDQSLQKDPPRSKLSIDTKQLQVERASMGQTHNESLVDTARRMENSFYENAKGHKQIKLQWDNVIRPLTEQAIRSAAAGHQVDERQRERLDTERSQTILDSAHKKHEHSKDGHRLKAYSAQLERERQKQSTQKGQRPVNKEMYFVSYAICWIIALVAIIVVSLKQKTFS